MIDPDRWCEIHEAVAVVILDTDSSLRAEPSEEGKASYKEPKKKLFRNFRSKLKIVRDDKARLTVAMVYDRIDHNFYIEGAIRDAPRVSLTITEWRAAQNNHPHLVSEELSLPDPEDTSPDNRKKYYFQRPFRYIDWLSGSIGEVSAETATQIIQFHSDVMALDNACRPQKP